MKNNSVCRRLSSLLLALFLLCSMSMPAFAADAADTPVCNCQAGEGAEHLESCPVYASSGKQPVVCTGLEGCTAEIHNEGCIANQPPLEDNKAGDEQPHQHSYSWEITSEASCFEEGVKTYTCAVTEGCDKPSYTEIIPATGQHSFVDGKCSTPGCSATEEKKPQCDKSADCPVSEGHEPDCEKALAEAAAKREADIQAVKDMLAALTAASTAEERAAVEAAITALTVSYPDFDPNTQLDLSMLQLTETPAADEVAKIGETGYETLAQAFAAAKDGDTITLLKNSTITETLVLDDAAKSISLELNGFLISSEENADPAIRVRQVSLTILDSSSAKTGGIDSTKNDAYCITVGSKYEENGETKYTEGSLSIEGGIYTGCVTALNVVRGSAELKDGTYKIGDGHDHGYGSTYLINCYDASYNDNKAANVSITGGKYLGFDPNNNKAETGGKTNFVAPGSGSYVAADGSYQIGKAVARVAGNDYGTLEAAFAVAEDGDTIQMLADASFSSTLLVSGKSLIFDMNGKTATVTAPASGADTLACAIRVTDGGALSVTGNGKLNTVPGITYCFTVGGSNAADTSQTGSLTIENGSFTGTTTVVNMVRGSATIKDGIFEASPYNGDCRYLLNCYDANLKAGVAGILVEGGSFKDFNPSDNLAENPQQNFAADGKCGGDSDGDGWYTLAVHDPDADHDKDHHWCTNCMKKVAHDFNGGDICTVCNYNKNPAVAQVLDKDNKVLNSYPSLQAAFDNAPADGTVRLLSDLTLPATAIVNEGKDFTLDLNEKTLSAENKGLAAAIRVLGSLSVKNGSIDTQSGDCYCIIVGDASKSGSLVVEDGEFKGSCTAVQVTQGSAEIKDGKYEVLPATGAGASDFRYLLNLHDGYKGKASISVRGGLFKGFDPADNLAENPKLNFLASGLCSNDNNGDGWYAVANHNPAANHDATHHWCSSCGVKVAHSGGTASCSAQAVCSGCNQPYGSTLSHTPVYTGSGNVITEKCSATGCTHSATATLGAASSYYYTGSDIKSISITYSEKWLGSKSLSVSYGSNTKDPGTVQGTVSVLNTNGVAAVATKSYEIVKATFKMWEHNNYYRESGKSLSFTIETAGKAVYPLTPLSIYTASDTFVTDVKYFRTGTNSDGDMVITIPDYVMAKLATGRYKLAVSLADNGSSIARYETEDLFRVMYPLRIPATGDSANFLLWGGLLLGAAAALGGTIFLLKRKGKN